jgi:hypothetical protein
MQENAIEMLSCIQLKESVFAVDEKVTAKLLQAPL